MVISFEGEKGVPFCTLKVLDVFRMYGPDQAPSDGMLCMKVPDCGDNERGQCNVLLLDDPGICGSKPEFMWVDQGAIVYPREARLVIRE